VSDVEADCFPREACRIRRTIGDKVKDLEKGLEGNPTNTTNLTARLGAIEDLMKE
jgi:hypothetical protein